MKKLMIFIPETRTGYGAEDMIIRCLKDLDLDVLHYDYRGKANEFNSCENMWKDAFSSAKIFNPDVILIYKGELLHPNLIKLLKTVSKVIYWFPDKTNYFEDLIRISDVSFFCDKTSANYFKAMGCNSHWLSFAFDQTLYKQLGPRKVQHTDITFAGDIRFNSIHFGRYQFFKRICEEAEKENWNLKLYGKHGKLEPIIEKYHTHSCVSNEQMIDVALDSKINLEFTAFTHLECGLTERPYKILAVGGFLLADYLPGMFDFWSNKDCIIYYNTEDCITKIKQLLPNKELRDIISINGMLDMHSNNQQHSYRTRLKQMFKIAGVEL